MAWVLLATTISGINLTIWVIVGTLRLSFSLAGRGLRRLRAGRQGPVVGGTPALQHGLRRRLLPDEAGRAADATVRLPDVCALVPAYNEEVGIADTLTALARILPLGNIYVVSDGSTDATPEIVRDFGLHVVEVWPNRGKAGALVHAIAHFDLRARYKAVLIVDADTEVDEHYLERALPLINQPGVVAVAGNAHSKWGRHFWPRRSMFYPAYRVRLYLLLQVALRYGQTWRPTNVTVIIPGFASMYRTTVLDQIAIDAKGLVIEDFNMTFEVHRKRLGRIAYTPGASATAHDPDNLRDYVKQVTRWNLGMMQTIRRHGVWPSLFWLTLGLFLAEILFSSLLFLAAPVLLAAGLLFDSPDLPLPLLDTNVSLAAFGAAVLLLDYALTAAVAAYERKPLLLFYGLGFVFLRYLDALLFLRAIPMTFTTRSDGRWESPRRYRYDLAPPGVGSGLGGAAGDAITPVEAPDPLPTRAGRLAMTGFSGVSVGLAVALVVVAVGVLQREGAAPHQDAVAFPGLADGPVRTGNVPAGTLQASVPRPTTPRVGADAAGAAPAPTVPLPTDPVPTDPVSTDEGPTNPIRTGTVPPTASQETAVPPAGSDPVGTDTGPSGPVRTGTVPGVTSQATPAPAAGSDPGATDPASSDTAAADEGASGPVRTGTVPPSRR